MNTDTQSRLFKSQRRIHATGILNSGFNCVLQMPTGSGKTYLARQAISRVLQSGYRAIYLTPLRALASELLDSWSNAFPNRRVGIFTGEFLGRKYPIPFEHADVLIMTPERLDACTRNWRTHWGWLTRVSLLVVDELHLLGDGNRGSRLEGTLSRLQRLNPFHQILGLSATLGNPYELAEWLGGIGHVETERPIELRWRTIRYGNASQKPELLIKAVRRCVESGGKSLVFVHSRRRAEGLAEHLTNHDIPSLHHHAGLDRTARHLVETSLRTGDTGVVVSTATLEMGLNLPVRQVVLYDIQRFDGSEFVPLAVNNAWQRGGRAGRPGLDDAGEAVVFAPNWDRQSDQYAEGDFESITSGLADTGRLAEQVVAEISSGLAVTPTQLRCVFGLSLAAYQKRLPDLNRVIQQMIDAGMVCEAIDEDKPNAGRRLRATRLGRVATRHLLSPDTVLLLHRVSGSHPEATFLDLLLTCASSPDCEPLIPVDFEELDNLADELCREPSYLLTLPLSEVVSLLGIDGKRLLNAIKTALILRHWTRLGDAGQVADQCGCYPFEVDRLRESCTRLLAAFGSCTPDSGVVPPQESERASDEIGLVERISILNRMVQAGVPERIATLTLLRGIGPKLAKRLYSLGIEDIEELALADAKEISGIQGVSEARIARWIDEASSAVKRTSAFALREYGPFPFAEKPDWPSGIDPYRLRRALDLKVASVDGGACVVMGGAEAHHLVIEGSSAKCDCADAAKGNLCKHVLAYRLHRRDQELRRLCQSLKAPSEDSLDLFSLWCSPNRSS